MKQYLYFIFRRVLQAIPTFLIVVTLSFFLIRLAPGGPFDLERTLPEVVKNNLKEYYNLDKNIFLQYLDYIKGILTGNLGPSYNYRDFSVTELLIDGFPYSATVGFWALLLAIGGGIFFGTLSAINKNTLVDYGSMLIAILGLAIPNFVLAPLLVLWFAVLNDWVPAGGWGEGGFFNLLLPVITLGTAYMGNIARLTRASMIEVLGSPYVRTARAKGLRETTIITRHVLKASLIPVISYIGPTCAGIITGSLVIEQIFGLPGIGRYFIQAALGRDYPLVMGTVVFYSILIIILNLLVDIFYGYLDPRIRKEIK